MFFRESVVPVQRVTRLRQNSRRLYSEFRGCFFFFCFDYIRWTLERTGGWRSCFRHRQHFVTTLSRIQQNTHKKSARASRPRSHQPLRLGGDKSQSFPEGLGARRLSSCPPQALMILLHFLPSFPPEFSLLVPTRPEKNVASHSKVWTCVTPAVVHWPAGR